MGLGKSRKAGAESSVLVLDAEWYNTGVHQKPLDLFDRDDAWASLDRFVAGGPAGAELGLVYGRRRQGKSHLLSALCEATGGFYFEAAEATSEQNLGRFNRLWAAAQGHDASLNYDSWEAAFAGVMRAIATAPLPVVIDEFNYLLAADPSLPSTLQRLLGPRAETRRDSMARLVLCGSAFSTMSGLLSGTAPLRGRATLELLVEPFDYLAAAKFWGVDRSPDCALALYGLVGGTPAYRAMSRNEAPRSFRDVRHWAGEHLLHPASALFREGRVVVDEDPTIRDRALSWAVLSAVAGGAATRSAIALVTGRDATSLSRPLELLLAVGLLDRNDDLLRGRRGRYLIAEPMVETHQLLIAPNERRLHRGLAAQVWDDSEHLLHSRIYSEAFERVCRSWLEREHRHLFATEPTAVGSSTIPCRSCPYGHRAHQVDVLALDRSASGTVSVTVIGEAKWRARPTDVTQLERLDHIRSLLGGRADRATLVVFSRSGFTSALERAARPRSDVRLVDLAELYAM